jgi:hypothetical protein
MKNSSTEGRNLFSEIRFAYYGGHRRSVIGMQRSHFVYNTRNLTDPPPLPSSIWFGFRPHTLDWSFRPIRPTLAVESQTVRNEINKKKLVRKGESDSRQ